MRPRTIIPLLAAVVALTACTGTGPGPVTSQAVANAGGGAGQESADELPGSITLAFAGDAHFQNHVAALLQDSNETWRTRLPELAEADFSMVNMEAAITDRGSPEHKAYTFRVPPAAVGKLALAGVDAVSAANNHAVDYGRAGLEQTLEVKRASAVPIVGIGADATEAFTPLTVSIKGVSTAVLASSQVYEETAINWSAGDKRPGIATNLDPARLRAATRAAAASHDLVVVFLHWGTEGSACPDEKQVETLRQLEADGADIIVGTHAHRVQGNGWHGRSFAGYGLGNFIWYNTSPASRSSGVLTVKVDARAARARGAARGSARRTAAPLVTSWTWSPKHISGTGVPQAPDASALSMLKNQVAAAQRCAGLSSQRTG